MSDAGTENDCRQKRRLGIEVKERMKIAVRMDDITPDMDWEKFLAFKEILDTYGIKPLIGVVPDNQDENLHKAKAAGDFWEYIKDLQENGWSIALHGWQHIYTTKKGGLFPLNRFSEFAGASYEKQKEMLQEGTDILKQHGIVTDMFMAPAHSYDKNTLNALKELGYTRITDGFGKKPYTWKGLTFYPISFMMSQSLKKKNGYTTMVVHANEISEEGMERYRKMFAEYKDKFVSYSEYLKQEPVKRGAFGHCREYILATAKRWLVKVKGL